MSGPPQSPLAIAPRPGYPAHQLDQSPLLEAQLMASNKKIRVGIVGLGFGAEFIPIYQRHPDAEMYAICRRHRGELDACGDRFGVATRYTSFDEMLRDPHLDAVHINSPI